MGIGSPKGKRYKMGQNGTKLTNKQIKTITALMASRTLTEACQTAKIGRSTLARWLKDETFKQALQEAENEVLRESSRFLLTGNNQALETIFNLMTNGRTETIRLRASTEWLNQSSRYRDLISIDERLTELEKIAGAK